MLKDLKKEFEMRIRCVDSGFSRNLAFSAVIFLIPNLQQNGRKQVEAVNQRNNKKQQQLESCGCCKLQELVLLFSTALSEHEWMRHFNQKGDLNASGTALLIRVPSKCK